MASSDSTPACLRWLAAGMVLALTSCSVVYDADDFRDSGPSRVDAPDSPDARPGDLDIASVDPPMVHEGEGTVWAVPVFIRGQAIAPDVEIVLAGAGFDQTVVESVEVSASGDLAGFPLRVPVLPDLAEGEEALLTITLRQGDQSVSRQITVQGLDELVVAAGPVQMQQSELRPRYSRIEIGGDVSFVGAAPVRLEATAEVRLDARVSVDGGDTMNATPGAPGPGGCAGGAPGSAGECAGGGEPGQSAGGGGGHARMGTGGGGAQGGAGGMETGRRSLVPLSGDGGNGGGGAGSVGDGGGGGGGGGVLALTSRGQLIVDQGAFLSAEGGAGATRTCNEVVIAGNGGGGSGGAILLRADGGFTIERTGAELSVRGGDGGGVGTGCSAQGGAGAPGRVRVDSGGAGALPAFVGTDQQPFRGPALGPGIPVVTRDRNIPVEVLGEPGETFDVTVDGGDRQSVTAGESAEVSLTAGRNQICVTVEPSVGLDVSEGVQCVYIVYIP